jgi:hypothetical protein
LTAAAHAHGFSREGFHVWHSPEAGTHPKLASSRGRVLTDLPRVAAVCGSSTFACACDDLAKQSCWFAPLLWQCNGVSRIWRAPQCAFRRTARLAACATCATCPIARRPAPSRASARRTVRMVSTGPRVNFFTAAAHLGSDMPLHHLPAHPMYCTGAARLGGTRADTGVAVAAWAGVGRRARGDAAAVLF